MTTIAIGASTARADQCQLVSKEIADHASAVLRSGTSAYIKYCQPCGDKPPTHSVHAKTIEVKKAGTGYTVFLDGAAVDLAYIFVSVGDYVKYSNLGITSGCKATDVTATYTAGTVQAPKPAAPANALAGTWSVTAETRMTSCNDGGAKFTDTWTVDGKPEALKVKTKLGGDFGGKVDGKNVAISVPPGAKSSAVYKLVLQDATTLSGEALIATVAKGQVCASYRSVTARKQ